MHTYVLSLELMTQPRHSGSVRWNRSPRKVSIVVLQSVGPHPTLTSSQGPFSVKGVEVIETTRVLISVSFLSDN